MVGFWLDLRFWLDPPPSCPLRLISLWACAAQVISAYPPWPRSSMTIVSSRSAIERRNASRRLRRVSKQFPNNNTTKATTVSTSGSHGRASQRRAGRSFSALQSSCEGGGDVCSVCSGWTRLMRVARGTLLERFTRWARLFWCLAGNAWQRVPVTTLEEEEMGRRDGACEGIMVEGILRV